MKKMISFFNDEEGATAIEYGLLAALIAIIMAVGAKAVGISLDTMFDNISTDLGGAVG
jgi:pilus assembly protein Flp/PilA